MAERDSDLRIAHEGGLIQDFETCLDRQVAQAVGRRLDEKDDAVLVSQLAQAAVKKVGPSWLFACSTPSCYRGCALRVMDDDSFEVVPDSESGTCLNGDRLRRLAQALIG